MTKSDGEYKKIKVLQVLGGLYCGGTEAFVMNIFRNIDKEKVEFEFLIHEKNKGYYDEEVYSLGGKIHRIPDRSEVGVITYIKNLYYALKKINPDVIHSHAMFNSGIVLFVAFIVGIKVRISHSHSSADQSGNSILREIFRILMQFNIRLFSTSKLACSNNAGEYLYGKRLFEKGKVSIINNGINLQQFNNITERDKAELKKEFAIPPNSYVIGIVSRLTSVKNPLFVIRLLEKVVKTNKDVVVVFAGDGPLRAIIENEAKSKNLEQYIRLVGFRDDVPKILSILNLFLLPSIYEGLAIVAIEAQASGVPCILSDSITHSADIGLDLVEFISLKDEDKWVWAIKECPKKVLDSNLIKKVFKSNGYEIEEVAHQLLQIYINGGDLS